MAKFRVEKDGQTFEVDVPEGQDPNAALAQATGGTSTLDSMPPLSDAPLPGAADEPIAGRSTGENITRGLGLAARVIPSAALKLPAGLADLGSGVLNLIPAGASKVSEAFGGDPIDARLPGGATQSVDDFLNLLGFPEPESFGERVVSGVGDIALTGGAGGVALAGKAPVAARAIGEGIPAISKAVPGILESIGMSASKSPKAFAALETTGATGAEVAGDLAQQADAGPVMQTLAPLLGGLAGAVAPTTLLNQTRRAATGITNFADQTVTGNRRAAKTLQEASADPVASAKAAADAPEGVLPARAAGDPKLRRLEERVIADDAELELGSARNLEAAEAKSLDELADAFGPTSNKADFQQTVIERAAAPGKKIAAGQPDEMLDDAARSFDGAYDDAAGFPISTQNLRVEGGNVPLAESLTAAAADPKIIAGSKVRKRIDSFLNGLLEDVSRRGTPITKAADEGVVQIDSKDLLEMRQIVRQEIRSRSGPTASSTAKAEASMLQNANRALTETLESQLPEAAAKALRATDSRYKDFVTVQSAVLRSGEKGLTPEALRASVKANADSQGQFARGKGGELAKLAEQGKDITSTLAKGRTPGKPDQAARITRDMTPEQLQVAKADMNQGLAKNASNATTGRLDGEKLLAQVKANSDVLNAAGFTPADISRIEKVGKTLKVIQARSPTAATKLLEDNVGTAMNLVARLAGAKSGARILKFFGGAGVGGSLILTQFGSKTMQNTLKGLSVDQADQLLRRALRGDKLVINGVEQKMTIFESLMTTPSSSLKQQAEAARTLKAFLLEPAKNLSDNESE